jgi:hypothetical protein
VDFSVLVQRNGMYRDAEQRSMAEFMAKKSKQDHPEDGHACAVATGDRQGAQR